MTEQTELEKLLRQRQYLLLTAEESFHTPQAAEIAFTDLPAAELVLLEATTLDADTAALLAAPLAARLARAVDMLRVCIGQIAESSDNEYANHDGVDFSVSEIQEFVK